MADRFHDAGVQCSCGATRSFAKAHDLHVADRLAQLGALAVNFELRIHTPNFASFLCKPSRVMPSVAAVFVLLLP
jgi:hypothetical protein